MRPRRTLPAALAALAATSLLLTACGSDDEGGGDDEKIKGADDASSAPPSPSPKESEPATDRPEIQLPSYAKVTFEESETGDPVKDAILHDSAQLVYAVEDAILKGELSTPALTFYNAGPSLAGSKKFIKEWVDAGDKWAGTIRYYDREVTVKDDRTASVVSCADENESWITKNPESEKQPDTTPSADNYVMYNTLLEKNDAGVWVTTRMVSERGADRCQP